MPVRKRKEHTSATGRQRSYRPAKPCSPSAHRRPSSAVPLPCRQKSSPPATAPIQRGRPHRRNKNLFSPNCRSERISDSFFLSSGEYLRPPERRFRRPAGQDLTRKRNLPLSTRKTEGTVPPHKKEGKNKSRNIGNLLYIGMRCGKQGFGSRNVLIHTD